MNPFLYHSTIPAPAPLRIWSWCIIQNIFKVESLMYLLYYQTPLPVRLEYRPFLMNLRQRPSLFQPGRSLLAGAIAITESVCVLFLNYCCGIGTNYCNPAGLGKSDLAIDLYRTEESLTVPDMRVANAPVFHFRRGAMVFFTA